MPGLCKVNGTLTKDLMTNIFKYRTDNNLNLFYNRTKQVAETLVLAVPGNVNSMKCADRAINSCINVEQPNPRIFWGYDGTSGTTIKTPEHLQNNAAMQLLKVMDTGLSISEVSCFLSHIAAWIYCIKINKPVVILEHDSVMLRQFTELTFNNSLEYLGHIAELSQEVGTQDLDKLSQYLSSNQYKEMPFNKSLMVPLTQLINTNYLLILGLHNYAIDPIIAKNLFSYMLKHGIVNPADAVIEQHDFTLVQTGIYAVQSPDSEKTSTIRLRKDTYTIPGVTT
jgi:GR25 family glycosyltransferase involved in LPS biosynthesis